jgi:hypothetical protein
MNKWTKNCPVCENPKAENVESEKAAYEIRTAWACPDCLKFEISERAIKLIADCSPDDRRLLSSRIRHKYEATKQPVAVTEACLKEGI